jgi:beta-glucanase (GH16 family)
VDLLLRPRHQRLIRGPELSRALTSRTLLAVLVIPVAVLVVLNSDAVAGNMGTVSARGGWRGGWAVAWSDNFDGPANSRVNQEYWEFDTGQGIFGTKEIERVTASTANVRLDGHGDLDLVARGHGADGAPGTAWTSGRIQTKRFFTPPPGGEMMVTASIEQPDPANGLGYWPAFWMLGADPSTWPADGEIDILEDINGLSEHSGTLHCGNMWQRNPDGTFGPCHEPDGFGSGSRPCARCQRGFHTYSVIIDRRDEARQQVRWYFDGREFFSVSESAVGPAVWTHAFDHGFTILLNVAIGGSYPDVVCRCDTPAAGTTSGDEMVVRDVAVYTRQDAPAAP